MLEGRGARRPTPKRALRIRDVHFALENNGWNCTLECEMHLSTSGSTRRGRRPTPRHPSRGPRRRRLSESVAKAPIAPRRTKRIVDIPRFFSPSIPARSAFATDSDMNPRERLLEPRSRRLPGDLVDQDEHSAVTGATTTTRIELDRPIERQSRHFAIQPRSSPAPKDALPAPGLRLRPPVRGRGRHVTAPPRPR